MSLKDKVTILGVSQDLKMFDFNIVEEGFQILFPRFG